MKLSKIIYVGLLMALLVPFSTVSAQLTKEQQKERKEILKYSKSQLNDKASKAAEFSSISDYLESEGLSFYKNDEINIVPGFFISMGSGQTSECTDKYFAVYFALLDLATEYQNGTIDNFGLLTKDSRGYIDISIACSLDNYMALKKAEHYIEQ